MPRRNPVLKQRSRELRRDATPAERILWKHLRSRRFEGFKFRRQHVIGPYIVDFVCAEAMLIVEPDGETHVGKEEYDKVRQDWLERQGYKVLRFWNPDLYEDKDVILEAIWRECVQRSGRHPLTPGPSPQRGEGRKNA